MKDVNNIIIRFGCGCCAVLCSKHIRIKVKMCIYKVCKPKYFSPFILSVSRPSTTQCGTRILSISMRLSKRLLDPHPTSNKQYEHSDVYGNTAVSRIIQRPSVSLCVVDILCVVIVGDGGTVAINLFFSVIQE